MKLHCSGATNATVSTILDERKRANVSFVSGSVGRALTLSGLHNAGLLLHMQPRDPNSINACSVANGDKDSHNHYSTYSDGTRCGREWRHDLPPWPKPYA